MRPRNCRKNEIILSIKFAAIDGFLKILQIRQKGRERETLSTFTTDIHDHGSVDVVHVV